MGKSLEDGPLAKRVDLNTMREINLELLFFRSRLAANAVMADESNALTRFDDDREILVEWGIVIAIGCDVLERDQAGLHLESWRTRNVLHVKEGCCRVHFGKCPVTFFFGKWPLYLTKFTA